MLNTLRVSALAASTVLFACGPIDRESDSAGGDGEPGEVDAGGNPTDDGEEPEPAKACNRMDLIFVVDDSGSMVEEQENLAANFGGFVSVLDAYQTEDGEPLDYRIAVTTSGRDIDYEIDPEEPPGFPDFGTIPFSESGDNGAMRAGCGNDKRWVESADGDVTSTFACRAEVGTGGPSIEMPLYATELALTARMSDGTNQGFLRDDALLAVVVLSDEDDCSRPDNDFTIESDQCDPEWPENQPVSHFVDFFDEVKGARGRWATAVIAGPSSCESSFGSALEAKRLKQFVEQTGDNATFSSICEGDLTGALADAIDNFTAACEHFPPVD